MAILGQIILFLVSVVAVWFFAGMLIESVCRIARRFCKTGFITGFFILGTLTSLSEFSVAVHATAKGAPEVSIGNLIGGSFVVLLFIVPMLAVVVNGIAVNEAISKRSLLILLLVALVPPLFVLDGNVTQEEGLIALMTYGAMAYILYRQRQTIRACDIQEEAAKYPAMSLVSDFGRAVIGSVAIFIAAHVLVQQSIFFADALSVSPAIVGLILLSVGTNIPELVIIVRAVLGNKPDVAFGNYLGGAAMNTPTFGLVAIANGTFFIDAKNFTWTILLMVIGFMCIYLFVRRKSILSRKAGFFLLAFYAAFLVLQVFEVL